MSEKLTKGKTHIRQGCDHKSISFDLDHSFEKIHQNETIKMDFRPQWSSLEALKGTFNADDFVFCDFRFFPLSSSLSCYYRTTTTTVVFDV